MKTVHPAGTRSYAVDGRKCLMRRARAMRAGIFLLALAASSATVAQAEPRILLRMVFDVSLMPEVHPLLSQQILSVPTAFEEPSETSAATSDPAVSLARVLLETGAPDEDKRALAKVTSWHLLPKPMLKPAPIKVKDEAFGLVKTMPQAYAGMMFGVGWLLLLISVGLGYLGRRIEPYSADDPATWNPDVTRPLASILIDPDEMRAAPAYLDHRL